jgi:hypothetical protein
MKKNGQFKIRKDKIAWHGQFWQGSPGPVYKHYELICAQRDQNNPIKRYFLK